jgi:hypothetical protein
MSTCLYESEAGDCQTALVVPDVCVESYGAGRVKEQCERDKKPIGGESGDGLSIFLDRTFSAARLQPLRVVLSPLIASAGKIDFRTPGNARETSLPVGGESL